MYNMAFSTGNLFLPRKFYGILGIKYIKLVYKSNINE